MRGENIDLNNFIFYNKTNVCPEKIRKQNGPDEINFFC